MVQIWVGTVPKKKKKKGGTVEWPFVEICMGKKVCENMYGCKIYSLWALKLFYTKCHFNTSKHTLFILPYHFTIHSTSYILF